MAREAARSTPSTTSADHFRLSPSVAALGRPAAFFVSADLGVDLSDLLMTIYDSEKQE
jgi:hypothetical protein